jgi:hypothetical protein
MKSFKFELFILAYQIKIYCFEFFVTPPAAMEDIAKNILDCFKIYIALLNKSIIY